MRLARGHILLIAGGAIVAFSFFASNYYASQFLQEIQGENRNTIEPGGALQFRQNITSGDGAYVVAFPDYADESVLASVRIDNPSGATVRIFDHNGTEIHHGVSPFRVPLRRGRGYFTLASYTLTAEAPSLPPRNREISANLNPWYIGNIVFGGLIGFLVVDPEIRLAHGDDVVLGVDVAMPVTVSRRLRRVQ